MNESSYIRLVESSCHNCMRCVRACPTKAMTYVRRQPIIDSDSCILCGRCYSVCPHEAKTIKSDFSDVFNWLKNGEQVVMSVAPSFVSVWHSFGSLTKILQNRGFSVIEETARGAKLVSESYARLIDEGTMENIISTCCPAVNALIEKEYSDLVPLMAPVVSPLIAHGRKLKEAYPNAKVVFLSPCIAKYNEIRDPRFQGAVDACISMEEMAHWISNSLEVEEESDWADFEGSITRLYPTPGGVLSTLPRNTSYKYVNVEGNTRIRKILESIRAKELSGYFIEMTFCDGSCMGGPLLSHFNHNEWKGQGIIRDNVDIDATISATEKDDALTAEWHEQSFFKAVHTEEEIQEEMIREGKISADRIHDCGACGYETCREKAIAVLEGRADPRICLPEAVRRAESMSGAVIQNTPNGIIILDDQQYVQEMNPAARHMLNLDMVNPTGLPISGLLPSDDLMKTLQNLGNKAEHVRYRYDTFDKLLDHAIVKIPGQASTILILMDNTELDEQEKRMEQMRQETLEVTQQVINDQMRSVQEIANLLGETTARSKVALTRLKKSVETDDDRHD